jgi:hypothetical protein
MLRLLVLILIVLVLLYLFRNIQRAVKQWRDEGESDAPVSIVLPEMGLDPENNTWQVVTRRMESVIIISVEHPKEGMWHEWKITASHYDAQDQVDKAIHSAMKLQNHLKREEGA